MEEKQLKEILEKHQKMLNNEAGGKLADLSGANLSGAYLSVANLRRADLSVADLSGATIYYTKLTINWIISTLNKSGINSKKQVRERLQNASIEELEDLEKSIQGIITEKILEQDFKKTYATIVKPQDVLNKKD